MSGNTTTVGRQKTVGLVVKRFSVVYTRMNHDTTANSPKESGTNATETSIPSHESRIGNNSLRPYRSGDFPRTMKRKASRISHHKAKREIRNAPWTPGDDYLLINSVVMVCNLTEVYHTRRLELHRRRGRLWARLRRNKEEARRWTRLVEMCITNSLEIMDPQPAYPALASLTGSRTQFLIKERKVIFGRNSFVCQPHIDLSMEGIDSGRVSRCHGQIRLSKDGIFWLANFSSHTVYVDGNPILTGFNCGVFIFTN
ncbi:unnamed protein product [Schistosoma rodhaini]|uniref:FHA domain-containing protein n=1 Tax=Schistosoma rodhaini TaxID=6188 RepID=A0AA85G0H6_9TREM|nr:unnamed protein product [Schistosoma rodhaini]